MEELMYYVWQQRMYASLTLSSDEQVEIINPGIRNRDAGPDFFNAKVKIGETIWAGNVEMHVRASDWIRHHHEGDAAYNNVILHVVLDDDIELSLPNGDRLLQAVMRIPDYVEQRYRNLMKAGVDCFSAITCSEHLSEVPNVILSDWLSSLAADRMMLKVHRVKDLINDNLHSWQEALYVMIARSMGTGINSDAFEQLARSLPYSYIQKHLDQPLQVEAMLMGQAGFLEYERPVTETYYNRLRQEYLFLRAKFNLKPLSVDVWRMARLRPQAFPHLRVAFLTKMLCGVQDLFSRLLAAETISDIEKVLAVSVQGFWAKHYTFSSCVSKEDEIIEVRNLGKQTLLSLIINAVVPIIMAYGEWIGDEEIVQRAISFLEAIPAEQNRYIRSWQCVGIDPKSAFDTQALLHLYREYCELHKCLHCRLGCWMMRKPFD